MLPCQPKYRHFIYFSHTMAEKRRLHVATAALHIRFSPNGVIRCTLPLSLHILSHIYLVLKLLLITGWLHYIYEPSNTTTFMLLTYASYFCKSPPAYIRLLLLHTIYFKILKARYDDILTLAIQYRLIITRESSLLTKSRNYSRASRRRCNANSVESFQKIFDYHRLIII